MKRFALTVAIGLSVALLMSCEERFEAVSLADFRKEWDLSLQDSAASWWYAGRDAEYHYFEVRRPLATRSLRVSTNDLDIVLPHELALTGDKTKWVNLKAGQLRFREVP